MHRRARINKISFEPKIIEEEIILPTNSPVIEEENKLQVKLDVNKCIFNIPEKFLSSEIIIDVNEENKLLIIHNEMYLNYTITEIGVNKLVEIDEKTLSYISDIHFLVNIHD
ncbi:hypothetical protein NUSPORA_00296 [Nucleospora cyclopteri]